jgi:hypothetical protein
LSFDDFQYRLHSLSQAQTGWLSVAHEPTSSTGEIHFIALPVAAWCIASYPLEEDGEDFDQPVGLVTTSDSMGPLESEDCIHLGYCSPGEDPAAKFREPALRKLKGRLRRAGRGA